MKHRLTDAQTGKVIILTCEDAVVTTETLVGDRSKLTSKSFASSSEATQQCLKKEWDLLKKGAVMRDATAAHGQPQLHLFAGSGYTGCLSFVATPHGIYVYKPGGDRHEFGTQDELLCIKADGSVAGIITLPGLLPWKMEYDAQQGQVLIDLDHYIYQYDISTASFAQLTHKFDMPASFVTVAAKTRAYGSHPFYYVTQRPYSQPVKFPLEVAFFRGSIPICASLSPDGRLLALHNQEGEVKLLSSVTGEVVNTLKGDFGIAEQLIWTKDASQLIVHTRYGNAGLYFFEPGTGNVVIEEGLDRPNYTQEVTDCCLSADNSWLVCAQRTQVFVFDFARKTFLYSFPIDHCIKTAHIKFVDERQLGVRTDYGCFSIYQL